MLCTPVRVSSTPSRPCLSDFVGIVGTPPRPCLLSCIWVSVTIPSVCLPSLVAILSTPLRPLISELVAVLGTPSHVSLSSFVGIFSTPPRIRISNLVRVFGSPSCRCLSIFVGVIGIPPRIFLFITVLAPCPKAILTSLVPIEILQPLHHTTLRTRLHFSSLPAGQKKIQPCAAAQNASKEDLSSRSFSWIARLEICHGSSLVKTS